MIQTLGTAQYNSMLLSAVRTGLGDGEMTRAFARSLIKRLPAIDGQAIRHGDPGVRQRHRRERPEWPRLPTGFASGPQATCSFANGF